jgi:hypothetical protein
MFSKSLIIIGASMSILWGTSHLFPTDSVVKGFGNISIDNQRIITMEWVNEGLTLMFLGILVILITLIGKENSKTQKVVCISSAVMLFSMAVLSIFTGFRIDFIPFRLCPFIFSLSGVCILQGAFRKS